MTDTEKKLWFHLRNRSFCNAKFKRQVPIKNYIADFVCFEKKLIIELDGGGHAETNQMKYDMQRDEFFRAEGFKVLRFWNGDINKNFDDVMDAIYKAIN